MSMRVRFLAFILLFLVLCILPSSRADISLSGTVNFNYDSGAGATGTVRTTVTYTLASPVSLTATELMFNLTGKTSGLPSSQFQIYAWNTSNTGIIPLILQTSTMPTYLLNVDTYAYSSPNITVTNLLSNQTVTADFGLLGGYTVKLYACSGTLASAPTLVANVLTFTVTDSGAGSATKTYVTGTGEAPYAFTQNGVVPVPAGAVVYNPSTDVVTVTDVGAWVLSFHQSVAGGGIPPSYPLVPTVASLSIVDPTPMLTIRIGDVKQMVLDLNVKAPFSYAIWNMTFDKDWVSSTGLPLTYTPNIPNPTGQVSKPTVPIIVDVTHTPAPGDYLVNVGIQWVYGLNHVVSSGQFHVRVLTAEGESVTNPTSLAGIISWFQNLTDRDRMLLGGGGVLMVGISAFAIVKRRRKEDRYYYAP